MTARVQLDQPRALFTNYDFVTGRIWLHLTSEEAISSIVVKLEGESKTRLVDYGNPAHDRKTRGTVELEVHKVSLDVGWHRTERCRES